MEPFSVAYLSSLAAGLTQGVIAGLGRALRGQIEGKPAQQALNRSLEAGIIALVAHSTAAAPEQQSLLRDIFDEFFHDPAVGGQVASLLRGHGYDRERLALLFADAGYVAEQLPELTFNDGRDAFAAAFLAAADAEPELQGLIQIGQLRQQTGLQAELLAQMGELIATVKGLAVGVRAGKIVEEGSGRVVFEVKIGQYVAGDNVQGHKNELSGNFQGATLHFVTQYIQGPGQPQWSEIDFRDALQTYLTVIEDRYSKPELRGNIEVKDRMPDITLEKMYYSLAALGKPEAREELRTGASEKSGRMPAQEPKQPVNMATLLRHHRRLVITGKPGSGKSTYLYVVASAVARALLGKGSDLIEKHVGLPAPLPLPIYISLGEFNEYRKGPTDPNQGKLLAYASSKAIEKYESFVPKDFFQRVIAGNQMCLFLLDGLDEIADEKERELVSEEIRSLSRNPKIGPIIVTCRSWAYVGDVKLHAPFIEYEVQSMSSDQVDKLVGLWCGAAYPQLQAPTASAKLSEEIRGLEAERLRRGDIPLADTPLMVTIIAIVFYNDEHLPNQRAALYKRCIRVLLIEKHHPTGEGKIARVTKGGSEDDKLELLALLAQNMMTADDGASRIVEEKYVQQWLLPLIINRQTEGRPAEHLRDFLRAMVDQAGILDERPRTPTQGRTYEFVHLSFQEYLCASRLAGLPPQQVANTLVEGDYVSKTWWRETILLMPGYLTAVENRPGALSLLQHLGNLDRRDAAALAAAELAAGAFLELGFNDKTFRASLAQRLAALLTDKNLTATNQLRDLAGVALGRLGDPRPGVGVIVRGGLRLPDIAWGETVPAGRYTVGDKDTFEAERRQVTIARPFQLARYPLTYIQFDCFIRASDFADERWWVGMPAEEEAYGTRYALQEFSEQAFEFANHPRERISWYQAVAFCRWLSDKLDEEIDLPHEYEWEVAARYPDGRFYPWGNTWDVARANTDEGGIGRTSAVGIFPQGANPTLGLYDLSGNVWEWCRNKFDQPDDDAVDASGARRVARGGSWYVSQYGARAAYRGHVHPYFRLDDLGCRVVRRPPSHAL